MGSTTIVVPVYDPTGSEQARLQRLINSIVSQSQIPERISFAANHKLDYFQSITSKLDKMTEIDFRINTSNGAASNLNNLIENVSTTFTKIMFQDDFFQSTESLSEIMMTLDKSDKSWIASGCSHYYEEDPTRVRLIAPKFSRGLVKGKNSIGAPSVVAVKTDQFLPFNQKMVYMFDCEWYLRMAHTHGKPALINKPLVSIGIHDNQATHWAKESLLKEILMCREAHKINILTGNCASCGIGKAKNG